MKIYNNADGKGENIIILSKKESQTLVDALEIAIEANKRKRNIKALKKKFDEELVCFD